MPECSFIEKCSLKNCFQRASGGEWMSPWGKHIYIDSADPNPHMPSSRPSDVADSNSRVEK